MLCLRIVVGIILVIVCCPVQHRLLFSLFFFVLFFSVGRGYCCCSCFVGVHGHYTRRLQRGGGGRGHPSTRSPVFAAPVVHSHRASTDTTRWPRAVSSSSSDRVGRSCHHRAGFHTETSSIRKIRFEYGLPPVPDSRTRRPYRTRKTLRLPEILLRYVLDTATGTSSSRAFLALASNHHNTTTTHHDQQHYRHNVLTLLQPIMTSNTIGTTCYCTYLCHRCS